MRRALAAVGLAVLVPLGGAKCAGESGGLPVKSRVAWLSQQEPGEVIAVLPPSEKVPPVEVRGKLVPGEWQQIGWTRRGWPVWRWRYGRGNGQHPPQGGG